MKRFSLKLISIAIIIIMMLSTFCYATSRNTLKSEQNQVNNKIDEKNEQLEEVKKEKSETMAEVENLTDKITSVQNEINELNTKVEQLNTSIKENEEKLAKAEEDFTKQQELLNERLVALFEAGDTTYLDVLLASDDFTDLISNWYLVSELATYDTDMLEKIDNQKKEIENTKNELETNKNELQTTKSSKQAKTVELKEAKEEKNKKVAELSEEEKVIQEELEQLQEDNARITRELKEAERKYAAQLEALKQQQQQNSSSNSSSGSSSSSSGFFIRPVKTGSITATWYYSSGSLHGALDYGVPDGTPVYASADGVVYKTEQLQTSYGTYIVIQHTNNMRTIYAHGTPGSICVKPGDIVKQGQLIMKSGHSGKGTGPHLHFEMRKSPYNWGSSTNPGDRVNPLNYL